MPMSVFQEILDALDPGMRESLNEMTSRLRKVAQQPDKLEQIDDTQLV